jgi:penicillin amidase
MTVDSPAATVWWTFWNAYLAEVFGPWWKDVKADKPSLAVSAARAPLNQNLERWTLTDPRNAVFTPPGAATRDAPAAMLAAFRTAVAQLTRELGADQAAWRWGRIHTREVPSLLEAGPLGYGPEPAGGDRWTVDAAEGDRESSFGPSYRLVVEWTAPGTALARSVYPGGQSENPAAAWYRDLLPDWWAGRLRDLPAPAAGEPPGLRWNLLPEGK